MLVASKPINQISLTGSPLGPGNPMVPTEPGWPPGPCSPIEINSRII